MFRVDPEIRRRLKIQAAALEKPMEELAEDILRQHLDLSAETEPPSQADPSESSGLSDSIERL